jgi:hypothetical protein
MYDQLFNTWYKVAEQTIQLQQQMIQSWLQPWGITPPSIAKPVVTPPVNVPFLDASTVEKARDFQKQWNAAVADTLKKQVQIVDAYFKKGVDTIEDTFKLAESKDLAEVQKKVQNLWKENYDFIKSSLEAQVKDFSVLSTKWLELMTPGAAAKV